MTRSRDRIEEIIDARVGSPGSTGRLSMAGPIKTVEVASAVDAIDIVGLDLEVDGEYEVVVAAKSGNSGSTTYKIYVGDDSLDETDANYDSNYVADGLGGNTNDAPLFAYLDASGESLLARLLITRDADNKLKIIFSCNQDTVPNVLNGAVLNVNAFTNIKRLRLKASQGSGFAVGTWVRVYRLGGALPIGTAAMPLDIKRAADGFDDEFNSSTLDASWTVVAGSSGTVSPQEMGTVAKYDLTTRSGWLLTQVKNGHVKLRKDYTLPVGKSIIMCISPGYVQSGTVNDSQLIGIGMNDNDTDYWQGNWFGIYAVDQDGAINFDVRANGNVTSSVDTGVSIAGMKAFLRIDREPSMYRLWVSTDGTSWYEIISTTNVTLTNLWFWHSVDNTAVVAPIAGVDWIRLGDSGLDPWPLVDGSSVQPVAVGEWRGALAHRTTNQTLPITTETPIIWESAEEDTDGFLDIGGTYPSRITIPAGVSRVRLVANVELSSVSADAYLWFEKNGNLFIGGGYADNNTNSGDYLEISTGSIPVVEGDYLQVIAYGASAGSIAGTNGLTWVAVEVIEPIVAITDKGSVNIASADSPYTMRPERKTVYVTADGAITINLPALVTNNAMEVEVKIISGTGAVTLDPNSSETIDGGSTYVFQGVGESRTFKAKGINGTLGWFMVARASIEPGRLIPFTCTSTEAVNDLVYVSAADTVAQAGAANSAKLEVIGSIFAKPTTTTCLVAIGAGLVSSSGLTAGAKVYLSDTLGQASPTEGTNIVELGIAKSTTSFVFTGAKVVA